jgi:hypothetical protein
MWNMVLKAAKSGGRLEEFEDERVVKLTQLICN